MGWLLDWHFKIRGILTVTLITILVFGLAAMAYEEVLVVDKWKKGKPCSRMRQTLLHSQYKQEAAQFWLPTGVITLYVSQQIEI